MQKNSNASASTQHAQLKKLAVWTFFWTFSQAVAVFGTHWFWPDNKLLAALSIALTVILGIAMIFANRKVLESQDELQRKIQLEAMALTLGLTMIIGLAYSMLDITNVITSDAEIGFLVMFMGICYLIVLGINKKRYE